MLNRAEFIQLQSTVLSHLARTMYVFYIKPQARQGNTLIDPVALASQLVSTSTSAPCSPSLEDIEAALNELEMLSLIEREQEDAVWQNASVTLPFFLEETKIVPGMPFTMFLAWEPSASLREVALNMGLADFSYQESELRDFISFWINNRMRRSQHGWETAFIRRLMKNRASDATRTYAASVTRAHTGSSRSRMQKRLDSFSTDPLQRAHFPDANSSDPRAAVMALPPGSAIAGQTVLPQGTGVQPITSYNPQLSEPAPGNQAAALAAVSSAASGPAAAVPATAGHVGAGNAAYSHAGQLPQNPFGKPGFGQQDGYGQSPYGNKTQGQTAPAYGMSAPGMPPHAAASQNMQPYVRTAQGMAEGRFARQGRHDAPGAYASGSYQGLQTAVGANRTAVSAASYGAGAASAQGSTDNMRHGQNQHYDYRRNNGSSWQKAPVHPDFIEHNNNDSQNRSWRDSEKDAYGSEPVWDDRQLGYESGYQASQPLPPRRDAAQRTAARAGIMQSSNSPDSEAYSPGVYAGSGVTGGQSPYYGQSGQPDYGTSGPQGAHGGPYQHHMPCQQAQDQGRYYNQALGQGHGQGQTTGQAQSNGPGPLPGTRQGYVQANGHNRQPYQQDCQGPQYSPDTQAMYSRQGKDELYGNNSRSYQGAYQSQRYTSPHGDHGMAAQGQQMQNGAQPAQYQNGSMSNGSPYGQPQPQAQYSPYASSQDRSQAAVMTDTAVPCSNTAGNSLVYSASASASPDETGSMSQPYALQNGQYSTNEKTPWAQSDESNAFNSTAQSSRSMSMQAHGGMIADISVSGYAAAADAGVAAAAAGRGDYEDSEERKKAERAEQKERRWLEKRNKTNYSALALEQARNQINDAAAAASAITSAAGAGAGAAADTSCGSAAASESDKGDSQLEDGSATSVAGTDSAAGAAGVSCAAGAADSSPGSSCPGTKKSWQPEGAADTQLARPRALRKPTLRSIASGKPEYELIAPGYSDPLNAGPFDDGFNGDDLNVSGTQTFSQAQGMGQGFTGSARTGNLEGAQIPANPFASFCITPSALNTMATADTAAPSWQHAAPAANGAPCAGAASAAGAVNLADGLSPAATYIPEGSADMSALADVSAMQPELYSHDALNNGEPAPEILPGFNPDDASGGLIMAAPQTFEQVMLMQEQQLADQNDLSVGGFDQSFMEELNREFNQGPQARLAAMEPEQLNQLHADSTAPSAPTTATAADASAVPDSVSAPADFSAAAPPDCTAAAAIAATAATAATEAAANADAGHEEIADGATQAAVESGSDVRDECEAAADSAAAEAAAADCAATEAAVDGDVSDEACGAVEAAVDGDAHADAGAAAAVDGDVPAEAGAAAETDKESGSGGDSLS